MKILLMTAPIICSEDKQVLARHDDTDNSRIPIGLYYLATLLREQQHEATLANFALTPFSQVVRSVAAAGPDLVGISCHTRNRHEVMAVCAAIKKALPQVKIILGGPHPTMLYEQVLRHYPAVDFVAVGESEIALPQLVQRLADQADLDGLNGIAHRRGEAIVLHGPAARVDHLDTLPIPARYFKYNIVSTSRGCPGRCTFCASPVLWPKKVRYRSPENILEEIDLLISRHRVPLIMFKDDTFTLQRRRLIAVCKGIAERRHDFLWTCDTRVDYVDEEKLYWLKKAGCQMISYGIESGSAKILSNIGKNITLDRIRRTAALTRKYAITMRFYLMAGNQGETDQTLGDTIDLLRQTRPNACMVSRLALSPGTGVYAQCRARGLYSDRTWLTDKRQNIYVDLGDPVESMPNFRVLCDRYARWLPENAYTPEDEIEAVKLTGDTARANYLLAQKFTEQTKYSHAVALYRKVITINPDFAEAYLCLGHCFEALGDMDAACDILAQFLRRPHRADRYTAYALSQLGQYLLHNKDYTSALEALTSALNLQPQTSGGFYYLGALHQRRTTPETMIDVRPQRADLLSSAGLACYHLGDNEKALAVLRQAIALNPNLAGAFNTLGQCHVALERFDDAQTAFKQALALNIADKADVYNNLGVVYFYIADYRTAEKYLRLALAEDPNNADARANLAQLNPVGTAHSTENRR